jgi:hypothetical protein
MNFGKLSSCFYKHDVWKIALKFALTFEQPAPEEHHGKTSAHAQELKMANILNVITQNKNMAIYSLDISETNKKIQKTTRL